MYLSNLISSLSIVIPTIIHKRVCQIARLPSHCAPYSSLIRVFPVINTLTQLYPHQQVPFVPFSCLVLLQLKGMFCVCAPINHSPPSLFSFILPYKAVLYAFFSFLCFKPLVTPLFIQLFCNNINVKV